MTGAPSATHIPGSSPVVVNTAMQPLEPPHSVVAAFVTWDENLVVDRGRRRPNASRQPS